MKEANVNVNVKANVKRNLSPTALLQFESDPEEFFIQRVAKLNVKKFEQSLPMAIGAAFDDLVKKSIGERFNLTDISGSAVEMSGNFKGIIQGKAYDDDYKTVAYDCGQRILDEYTQLGLLSSIFDLIKCDPSEIVMEEWVKQTIEVSGKPNMSIIGKPDLLLPGFVLDWKVNGYCSQASPMRGYVNVKSLDRFRGLGRPHKDAICLYTEANGQRIMVSDIVDEKWALQVATYNRFLPCIGAIDQVCGHKTKGLRFAQHRFSITQSMCDDYLKRYQVAWDAMHSDNFFTYCGYTDDQAREVESSIRALYSNDFSHLEDSEAFAELGRLADEASRVQRFR